MLISYAPIQNKANDLLYEFLDGKTFEEALVKRILSYIEPDVNIKYNEEVLFIKNMFFRNVKKRIIDNVIFYTSHVELEEIEKAVFIHFLNMSLKRKKYFIVLNNELVYIPIGYRESSQREIELHIASVERKLKNDNISKSIKSSITNVFSFLTEFLWRGNRVN